MNQGSQSHENKLFQSLSFPNASIGNLVIIKPDSRLKHAGMTNNGDFRMKGCRK